MTSFDQFIRLQNLCLWFRLSDHCVTIDPHAAPPDTPESEYRPVTISYSALEALLIAQFMSSAKEGSQVTTPTRDDLPHAPISLTPEDLSRNLEEDLARHLAALGRGRADQPFGRFHLSDCFSVCWLRRAVAAERERDGLKKAVALLTAGMESQCELMDGLKQRCRAAEAELERLRKEQP